MPLPKPKQNETRKDFMQRCMNNSVMITEYKDANQRIAVCSSIFKKKISLFINKKEKKVKKVAKNFFLLTNVY